MGRSGIVENTKMPFDSLGQPLGSILATFIVLILLALIFLAVSLLLSGSANTNQNQPQSSLFCDNSLNTASKNFHKTNTKINEAEVGLAVPASVETANSANPIFKETLMPIRKFEYAVGFT